MPYLSVALVGRPNVGKSTLLNGIVGKTVALVEDTPGITRDGKTHRVRQGSMICDITDTAGYVSHTSSVLDQSIWQHTREKLHTIDLLVLVVDGHVGLHPQDIEVMQTLRRLEKPWILVVNKSDRSDNFQDFFTLGAQDMVVVSALHRRGLDDIWRVWKSYARTETVKDTPPRIITIWGRPNVGKSSLINMLTQSQVVLAGETSGLTRDSVGVPWSYKGEDWKFVDTAGLQKKKWVNTNLEHRMHAEAFRALVFSQVAVLVLEPFSSLLRQDALLGSKILDEGRALVVVVNKWDQCEDKKTVKADIQHHLSRTLSLVQKVPIVFCSALRKQGRTTLIQAIDHAYTQWTRRISTPDLNRWWKHAMVHHTLQGKIKYIAQTQNRPPTFTFFGGGDTLSLSQKRHLTHKLQQDFSLEDTVIRCYFKP